MIAMKKSLLFAFCAMQLSVFAQQDFQFSQTMANPYLFNPAAGGMMNVGEVSLGNRMQWMKVDGRPTTTYASIVSQIKTGNKASVLDELSTAGKSFYSSPQRTIGNKHVLGARMYNDRIGPFTKNAIQASYAYHLPLTKTINMGVGLGLGWSNFAIDQSKISLGTPGDQAYQNYFAATKNQNYLDINAGLVVYNDVFFFGFSGTQLGNTKARINEVESESNLGRHYYFSGAYRFKLGTDYAVEPLAQLKLTKNAPLSYDIGARFHYQRFGWLALSYRSQSAASIGFGINVFKHFRVSYAYEVGLGGTRTFGSGAHEVQLGFIFGHRRNMEKEFKQDEKEKEKQGEKVEETPKGN